MGRARNAATTGRAGGQLAPLAEAARDTSSEPQDEAARQPGDAEAGARADGPPLPDPSPPPARKRGRPPRFAEAMSDSLRSRLKREARRGEIDDTLRLVAELLLAESPEAAAFRLEISELRGGRAKADRVFAEHGLSEEWRRILARFASPAAPRGG